MDETDAAGAGESRDDASARPVTVESREAYEALVDRGTLLLVEFVTPGCGICASMEPVLGTVARAAPATVAVVDATTVPELAREYDVRKAPTLLVIRDGEVIDRLEDGFQPADSLVDLLESHAG